MQEVRSVSARVTRAIALSTAAVTMGAFSVLAASPAFAATSTVCASGCDFTTIQDAVNAAADGDTINIGAGTYNESVTIDKSLTLAGPNASISPNTSNPLTANGARAAEAIIRPAVGDGNDAFTVTSTATNVVFSGLSIDLTDAVSTAGGSWRGQRFISAYNAAANGSITLTNNILTGNLDGDGNGPIEGSLVYKSTAGNTSFTVTGNRFTKGGVSNGMFINNSSASAVLNLTITDNVWLDNAYTAGNFSTDNGTTITGNIKNNWLGNSTPGTSGVDNYYLRQGGFLFAGEYDGFHVTGNTFKDIEDVAIYFWGYFSAPLV